MSAVAEMRAIFFGAIRVQIERMFVDGKTAFGRHLVLSRLYLCIEEFLYPAALEADQMIMMLAFVQFENRLAGLEKMPLHQACVLELRQDPVNGGEADIDAFGEQMAIDVFCRHVPGIGFLHQFENPQARIGRLEADVLQIVGIAHCG